MYRDVIFRLSVEKHPELASRLSGFATEVGRAYDEIAKQNQAAQGGFSGTSGPLNDASVRESMQARVQAERATLKMIHGERVSVADLEAQVDADRRNNELGRLQKFADQRLKLEQELVAKIAQITANTNTSLPADVETSERLMVAARKATNDKLLILDEALNREREAMRQRSTKQLLAELKGEEKALEVAESKYKSMQEQIRSGNRQMLSTMAEMGSSIMQVARGFASLGLAGEEDMQKIVQGLLRVQGAFDIVTGAVHTWTKWQQVIEGVRKSIQATEIATKALAEADAARAAINALGGVVPGASGSAAGGAAGSAAAGAAGGAVGGYARTAGQYAMRGLSATGRFLGGRLGGGAALGGIAAYDLIRGGGTIQQGSATQRFGSAFQGVGGYLDEKLGITDSAAAQARQSGKRLSSQEAWSAKYQEGLGRQVSAVDSKVPDLSRTLAEQARISRETLALDLEGLKGRERGARIAKEILETEKTIASTREASEQTLGAFESLKAELSAEVLRQEQRKQELMVAGAQLAKDAAAEELESSKRSLQVAEARLSTQQETLMSMQRGVASASERFGLMDEGQQQSLLSIFRRGSAGETLQPEELRALKQIGSEAADAIVAGQAAKRAESAGAGELFKAEQDKIANLERDIARNVSVAADIRWELEFDQKQLDEQTANLDKVVREGLKTHIDKLTETVSGALNGEIAGINVRIDGLSQRLTNGAGGRN